jgi:hypothetical protein
MVCRAIVEDADQETMGCFCRLALQHALDSREVLTGGDAALTATAPKAQVSRVPGVLQQSCCRSHAPPVCVQ